MVIFKLSPETDVLIGVSDSDNEGTFIGSDNAIINYTHWDINEPNPKNSNDKDCVVMLKSTGRWKTISCQNDLFTSFVCEVIMENNPSGLKAATTLQTYGRYHMK